jgi:hypothetical protein
LSCPFSSLLSGSIPHASLPLLTLTSSWNISCFPYLSIKTTVLTKTSDLQQLAVFIVTVNVPYHLPTALIQLITQFSWIQVKLSGPYNLFGASPQYSLLVSPLLSHFLKFARPKGSLPNWELNSYGDKIPNPSYLF